MNRTLEAMLTHRTAERETRPAKLAQLARDDTTQSGPTSDAKGVSAYTGERAIASVIYAAEEQKLYYRSETVVAGVSTLLFLVLAIGIPYFFL